MVIGVCYLGKLQNVLPHFAQQADVLHVQQSANFKKRCNVLEGQHGLIHVLEALDHNYQIKIISAGHVFDMPLADVESRNVSFSTRTRIWLDSCHFETNCTQANEISTSIAPYF